MASVVSQLFDAVSGLFLEALGTDMTAMEEYFPFVTKAYDVMQVTAWAILILITIHRCLHDKLRLLRLHRPYHLQGYHAL